MPSANDPFWIARLDQLKRDLQRSPEERLLHAEESARLARAVRPRQSRPEQIIGFDSVEEFWEWKKANR